MANIKRQGHVNDDVLLFALDCIRDMVRKDKRQIGAHLVGQQSCRHINNIRGEFEKFIGDLIDKSDIAGANVIKRSLNLREWHFIANILKP